MSSGSRHDRDTRAALTHGHALDAYRRMHQPSCCGLTRPNGSHISIRARTHGFDPDPRPRAQNSPAPPTHHHMSTKVRSSTKEHPEDGRFHPRTASTRTCERTPAAVRPQSQHARPSLLRQHEPARVTATSVQRSPSLSHPSGPRRPSHHRFASVCVILHPSLVSTDHRFIRSSECKVSYTTVAGCLGN